MAAVGALAGTAGCYALVPMEPAPAPSTAPVEAQVELTDEGRLRMAGVVGPRVEYVRGRLITAGPDTITVAVQQVVTINGDYFAWTGEPVAIARPFVSRASVRKLDKVKTSLVFGLGLAAIGTAASSQLFGFFGGDTPTTSSNPGGGGPAN